MPRKPLERSDLYPYHICARSNNRDWFHAPAVKIYDLFADSFEKIILRYGLQFHAFVLMANHFHLLATSPFSNIDQGMRYLQTETSRGIARLTGRINKIYGSRYHWTIIKDPKHYAHALKYIYLNPVKPGIVIQAEQYEWSTLNPQHEKFQKIITKNTNGFEEHIPNERQALLDWINQAQDEQYTVAVNKALRRHDFKFPRGKSGFQENYDYALLRKNTTGT